MNIQSVYFAFFSLYKFWNPADTLAMPHTSLDHIKRKTMNALEQRRYARFSCVWDIRFCELGGKTIKSLQAGKCKNLSQGGMKITALQPLEPNTVVLLELNTDRLATHIRTKEILFASPDHLLAEVAWRHLNLETGLFEAGVRFLEADERDRYESHIAQASTL